MSKKFLPKTVHLEGVGVEKVLGELESAILKILWQYGELNVRKMQKLLEQTYKKLSINAVMTIMNRLVEKKVLKKQSKEGIFVYSPNVSQEEFSRTVTKDILSSVIKDPALFSVSSFAELVDELDDETLQKLRQFINKKKK